MERVGDDLLFFRGLSTPRENLAFRQDKTFWYLTGIESPGASLLLDGKTKESILFLPARTESLLRHEEWEGEIWDAEDGWVKDLTGITDVRSEDVIVGAIQERLRKRGKRIGISYHPTIVLSGAADTARSFLEHQRGDPFDGRISRADALQESLERLFEVEVFDVAPVLDEMRRVKTPDEIAALRRAANAGSAAMIEAIRSTRPGLGEWDLDALMSFVHVREGAAGKAYRAIVGSGPNACVLHYGASSRLIEDGEVVLIDYGPEVDQYVTDITRAWPANGTFTERQRDIYEAVLAAQKAGIAAAKPGVTMREVSDACAAVMRERGFGDLIKHSACHYVGMEVHDSGAYGAKAVPGVVFTIEPGLYDVEMGIGVRIEDVIVITEDGCEVLTSAVPKELDEIEALVRSEGILDRIDGESE